MLATIADIEILVGPFFCPFTPHHFNYSPSTAGPIIGVEMNVKAMIILNIAIRITNPILAINKSLFLFL
jgi:hypothetical protein